MTPCWDDPQSCDVAMQDLTPFLPLDPISPGLDRVSVERGGGNPDQGLPSQQAGARHEPVRRFFEEFLKSVGQNLGLYEAMATDGADYLDWMLDEALAGLDERYPPGSLKWP